MTETKMKYRIVISDYIDWKTAKEDFKKIPQLSNFMYIEGYNPDGVPT